MFIRKAKDGSDLRTCLCIRRIASSRFLLLPAVLFVAMLVTPIDAMGSSHRDRPAFNVAVMSSAADRVTGVDARLHIEVPRTVPLHQVRVLVNGNDQRDHFLVMPGTRTLSGVVDGLLMGDNTVEVAPNGRHWRGGLGRPDVVTLTLTNHPRIGPVFSGFHQYPFVCTVQKHGLGQAIMDNDSVGFPVYATDGDGNPTEEITGYSKDCSAETLLQYVYKSTGGGFQTYLPGDPKPVDMAQTTTMDGDTVDYFVRWERGTINRFIYSIATLTPFDMNPDRLDTSSWNGRLIYYFQGGVAIGHDQGDPSFSRMLYDYGLSQGYAIAYSTGNKTGTHYNLQLGGETALMVKERFIELYDTPVYTVGVGGSGGGIQQYVYGQNHKSLIDAAIPQYSYPDMVTQTIHVGDCELMEFYMDVLDGANPRWQDWTSRTLLEGMNASNTVFNPFTQALGNSECVNGWRGLSPLALNPLYGFVDGQELIEPQVAVASIEWTHFGDLVNIYGVGDDGYARSFWDNVGVQYGLDAVTSGAITPQEFMLANHIVGGWKDQPDMVQEGSPFFPPGVIDFSDWDPWSARNQNFSMDPTTPAPRTEGDLLAMQRAYEAGLVFMGDMEIPIIDWRNYLERELDMHNSHQSFAARQRLRVGQGSSDNQVIWFTDTDDDPRYDQTPEAFQVMDEWMRNIHGNPQLGVAANKPADAVDRCFDADGIEIAAGDDVWGGILDDDPEGACTTQFPVYGTSRIVADGPFKGSIFKCALQPVSAAIARGLYGVWTPSPVEQAMLEQIFPDGVCDFDQPDAGLPPGW